MKALLGLLALITSLALPTSKVLAQQIIEGSLTDYTGEIIIGANVKVFSGENFLAGSSTDFYGNYKIPVDPGEYTLEFSYIGYDSKRLQGILVSKSTQMEVNFQFKEKAFYPDISTTCHFYGKDLYDPSETSQGLILYSNEIRRISKPN